MSGFYIALVDGHIATSVPVWRIPVCTYLEVLPQTGLPPNLHGVYTQDPSDTVKFYKVDSFYAVQVSISTPLHPYMGAQAVVSRDPMVGYSVADGTDSTEPGPVTPACRCDIRALMSVGHDKGCPEKGE